MIITTATPSTAAVSDSMAFYKTPSNRPEWAKGWIFPGRKAVMPTINLERISVPTHPFSNDATIPGHKYFKFLIQTGLIVRCVDLMNGRSIVACNGCYSIFKNRRLMLWQSVVYDNHAQLYVPFIQALANQTPIIYWLWLEYRIDPNQSLGLLK